jgi:hypothetical protein
MPDCNREKRTPGSNRASTAADVAALRLLAIDCDSIKPRDQNGNKSKVNSSDAEKKSCLDAVYKIRESLISMGYQDPMVVDSGSGHWLFMSIPEIPVDDANRSEMMTRLKTWGVKFKEKFEETGIDLDPSVFELHRLTKIPGTKVFTYPDEPERPQRISSILTTDPVTPDEKLRKDFLTMPVEIPQPERKERDFRKINSSIVPNIDRMIERCHVLKFIEGKSSAGVSLPHQVRLALSTFSEAVDDLDNGLPFIKRMLSGCPDFNEAKTARYLELNRGKSSPYGCDALRELAARHFKDFDPATCSCKLDVTHDKSGNPRKPSPIRYAGVMAEDLNDLFSKAGLTGDPFSDFLKMKEFSETILSQVDKQTAKMFFDSVKQTAKLNKEKIGAFMKARKSQTDEDTNQAQRLIELAAPAELFKTPDDLAYATFEVSGHRETSPLKASRFRNWLKRLYYNEAQKPPASQPLQDALGILESKAMFEGKTFAVNTRIEGHGDAIYLDLANESWEAVKITATGWKIVQDPPVKFRRPKGMAELPYPSAAGDLERLKKYLNLTSDKDFKMAVAFLVGSMQPDGPFPILAITGEAGAAKSTGSEILKRVLDPASSPLRSLPSAERDLMIAGTNNWLLAFDNVSSIPGWLSDALCRLSTGGGLSTRELYSDDGEVIFDIERPVILNGITDYIGKHDLADRTITISMAPILEKNKQTEKVLWKNFDRDHASILGAICDAVSGALRNQDSVKLERMTRMADFCLWITAAEEALGWPAGDFMRTYRENIQDLVEKTLEADAVATAVRDYIYDHPTGFIGTPSEFLKILNDRVDDQVAKLKAWPKAAHVLSGKLRRAATSLRTFGVEVTTGLHMPDKTRGICIQKREVAPAGSESTEALSNSSLRFVNTPPTLLKNEASAKNKTNNESIQYVTVSGDARDASTLQKPLLSSEHVSHVAGDGETASDASSGEYSETSDGKKRIRIEL